MKSMHDILKTITGNRVIIRESVANRWLSAHGQSWDDTEAMDIVDTWEHERGDGAHERGIDLGYIEAESIACATFNQFAE